MGASLRHAVDQGVDLIQRQTLALLAGVVQDGVVQPAGGEGGFVHRVAVAPEMSGHALERVVPGPGTGVVIPAELAAAEGRHPPQNPEFAHKPACGRKQGLPQRKKGTQRCFGADHFGAAPRSIPIPGAPGVGIPQGVPGNSAVCSRHKVFVKLGGGKISADPRGDAAHISSNKMVEFYLIRRII